MHRLPYLSPLYLLFLLLRPAPATAQVELNPYVGLVSRAGEYIDPRRPADAPVVYGSERNYALGTDAFFGKRRLAPLAGLLFTHRGYAAGSESFSDSRLLLPLGAAYRLRHPNTSFNVQLSAAVVPGISLAGDATPISEDRSGLSWGGRGGVVLCLDFITLGGYWYRDFGSTPIDESQKGAVVFALGVRF